MVYDKSVEFAGKCYNVFLYIREGTCIKIKTSGYKAHLNSHTP